ncbi:MAG: hypothetical protein ACI9CD_000754 [Candidatus Deianiraeaceae bacterium]|jgi:hypothetical protein
MFTENSEKLLSIGRGTGFITGVRIGLDEGYKEGYIDGVSGSEPRPNPHKVDYKNM